MRGVLVWAATPGDGFLECKNLLRGRHDCESGYGIGCIEAGHEQPNMCALINSEWHHLGGCVTIHHQQATRRPARTEPAKYFVRLPLPISAPPMQIWHASLRTAQTRVSNMPATKNRTLTHTMHAPFSRPDPSVTTMSRSFCLTFPPDN